MVMGIEEIFFGLYFVAKGNKIMSLTWLLRGASLIVPFSFSLWLFRGRSLHPWHDSEILMAVVLPWMLISFAIEAYLKVRFEHKSFSPLFEKQPKLNPDEWEQARRIGKV